MYRRKLKKLPPPSESQMTTYLEDLFLATPLDEIWAIVEGNNQDHAHAQRVALRWHAKWELRTWVKNRNVAKGMAVPSRVLAQQYNRIVADIPFEIRPKDKGDPSDDKSCRVFLHRWRFAMRSKWGRITVREFVSLEEKQKKVPL